MQRIGEVKEEERERGRKREGKKEEDVEGREEIRWKRIRSG